MVWWAALRANPKRRVPYWRYAILGDDVVILDSDVAREYYLILQGLNVKVSEKKSFLSSRGGLEFAKKFMCWGARVDLSPISIPSLSTVNTYNGLRAIQLKYKPSLAVLFRLSGAGYRVLGRLASNKLQSRVWERLRVLLLSPLRPSATDFELWLGGGEPLNPYLRGHLWWWLADQTRPKEPWIPMGMEEDEVNELEMEFLERTCVRVWMQMWLRVVSDHVRIVSDMNSPLLSYMQLQPIASSPFRSTVDPSVQRFGLLWKLYMKAQKRRTLPLPLGEGKYRDSLEEQAYD